MKNRHFTQIFTPVTPPRLTMAAILLPVSVAHLAPDRAHHPSGMKNDEFSYLLADEHYSPWAALVRHECHENAAAFLDGISLTDRHPMQSIVRCCS